MTKKQAAEKLANMLRDIAADCLLAGYGNKTATGRVMDYYSVITDGLVISDDAVGVLLSHDDGDEGVDLAALTRPQE